MREIEKEDLLKHLQKPQDPSNLDMDAVDFVLLKLNEIKHEVNLRLKDRQKKNHEKSGS